MKVGIITFQQTNNYGAILQSYALHQKVKSFGYDVEVINYQCDYISKPYRLINLKRKGLFSYLFGIIGYTCYLPRGGKCNNFRKYITYSPKVDKTNINTLSNKYDLFFTGSDQVWNYKLTNSDYNYLLEFVKDSNKKFSYAASFGISKVEEKEKSKYKVLLEDFNKITVREESGKEIVEELLDKDADVVLDPTFLLNKEQWLSVANNRKVDEDYILVYQLGLSSHLINFVKRLAKEKGCKVIYIPFPLGKFIKCKINLTSGPAEWLSLFNNAKYVVTDSFHGTVFSIIFNKNFFTEISKQNSGVGLRIENLLRKMGLLDRLIATDKKINIDKEIDYEQVNIILEEERSKSINILEEMLNTAK